MNKALTKAQIGDIFTRFSQQKPEPHIELEYSNPYTLLVAVILSAQATDKGVNKATPALFAVADSPEKMLLLGEEKLKDYVKTIGLFNTKSKNIILMSQMLVDKHNSQVPNTLEELEKLPGVGRKSANVMLNCIWQHKTIAVDTHVQRVSNRIGLCNTKTPIATEKALMEMMPQVPEELQLNIHHWLVLHGRYVCKAKKPDCDNCVINDICKSAWKTL